MPGAPARRAGLSRLQFIDVLERLKESGELGAIQAQYRAAHTDQAPPAQAQASGDSSAKRCAAQSYAAAVSQTSSPTAGHKARSGDTFGAKLTSGALLVQSDPEPVPRKRKAGRQRRGGGSRSAPPPDVEAVLRAPQDRFPEFMKDFEESTRPSPSRPEAREVVAHEGGQGSGQGGEGPRTPPRVARSADLPPLTTPSSPTGGAASPRSASTEGHTRRALLDKLNSPERLRASAEETAKRNAARHAKAEANRAKLEVLRQAKLREKANKVRAVSERAAKLKPGSTPPQSLETRLAAAVSRKQAHIDSVRQKATSENQKVGEVGFINTMNRAGRQADMQQRHARVAVRRETHLASVAAKAGTSAARAGRVAADRHALEAQEAAAKAASLEKRLVEGAARRAAALSDRVAKAASDSPRSTPPPGKSRWGVDGQGQVTSYETSPPRAGEAGKATSYAAAVGLGQAGRKGSARAPAAPARVAPLSAPRAETAPPLPDPAPVQRQKRSVRRSPSTKRAPKHSKGTSWDGLSSDVTSLVLTGEFASPVPRSGGADDAAFAVTPTPAPAPSPPRRQARKSLTSATTHPRDGDAAAEDAGKEELEALLRGRAADSEASGPSPLRLFRLSRLGLRPDAAPEAVAVALEAAKRAKTRARKVRKALHKAAKPVPEDGTGRLGRVPPNLGPRLTRALGAVLRAVHTDGSSKLQHPTLLPLACPLPGTLSTALSSLLTVLDSSGAYCEAQATLPEGVLSATFRLQRLFDQGQEEADEGGSEFRAVPGTGAAKDITSEAASTAVSLRMTGVQAAALAEGGFLRIAASTCTPHHFEQQPSLLVLALRVLLLACALPDNCTHMLEHGLVVPIVDTLATALDALPLADMGALAHFQPAAVCSEHLAALGHAEPARWSTEELVPPAPLDEVARKSQPVAVVMASLQFLWLLYRKAGPQLSLLSKYMVHAGVLQRLTTLTGLLRDSPTLVAFSPLLRTVMAFHVSVLNSHPAQRVPVLHGPSSVAAGDVVTSCVLSTHLLGAPSLLLGILMAVAPRARTRTHTRPRTASGSPGAGASDATTGDAVTALPPSALATCVLALKVTNAALRLDLKAVSTALGEATTQTSIFHALEHLLAHIGQHLAVAPTPGSGIDVTEELLWEVLLLTGYLLRGGGGHAEMLRWGPPPTPLQRLVTLPFRYFTQHPYTAVLLPTLLAACAADAGNAEVVLKHVSKDMLLSFLGAVAAGGATGQPSGTVVVHETGVRLAPFGGMPAVILPPALAGLVPRLPKAFMPQHRLDLSEAGMSAMRGALAAAEGATSPLSQSLEGQVTPPSKTAPDFDAMD